MSNSASCDTFAAAATETTDFRFCHHLRVRWSEVDMQKIVFNAHYLSYFDTAITDYWRALGLPYAETLASWQGDLYLKKASVEYHASARMDERLDVRLRCARLGTSSMLFHGLIVCEGRRLITGELLYVFADPHTQTARAMPSAMREWLQAYEAGADMLQLRLGSWPELQALATPLRTQVFVHEQGVPPELELDARDAHCMHAVLVNRLGTALATGRLLPAEQGTATIGRMAVMASFRGAGLGEQVLQALMQAARERGDHSVSLHAQCSARAFYERQGFEAVGEVYEEAGLQHITMQRRLV